MTRGLVEIILIDLVTLFLMVATVTFGMASKRFSQERLETSNFS
jgi:hypothetical protein